MQIERDTYGKLQCHPYPHEYVDFSKKGSHCAFFMGLQRRQGEVVQEGQQFDIRATVDEFKKSVYMYNMWKPEMEIHVSHLLRKRIPLYVLPEGYRRTRPQRLSSEQLAEKLSPENSEGPLKRKKDSNAVPVKRGSPKKRKSISPERRDSEQEKLCGENAAEGGCSSSASVVTHLAGVVSSCEEDFGLQSVHGSSEGSPTSVAGSSNSGSSQGSCEAGSETLLEIGCDNNGSGVFQGGLREEFEVSN